MKVVEWDKDKTIHNETINIPRKSMKGILMLFTKKAPKDSEELVNPSIESIKVTIEGVPNMIYSESMPTKWIFEEAQRFF